LTKLKIINKMIRLLNAILIQWILMSISLIIVMYFFNSLKNAWACGIIGGYTACLISYHYLQKRI